MSSLEILNDVLLKPIQIWDTYCDTKLFKVHLGIRCIRKRTCNDEIFKLKCGFSIAFASAFCGSSMLPTLSSLLLTDETRCHLPMVAFCILYIWTCQELCLFDSVCISECELWFCTGLALCQSFGMVLYLQLKLVVLLLMDTFLQIDINRCFIVLKKYILFVFHWEFFLLFFFFSLNETLL